MRKLYMIADLLDGMPLAELASQISRAETLGPILDPTLYIQKGKALGEDQDMVRAAIAFRDDVTKRKRGA